MQSASKIPPASCAEIARIGFTSGAKPSCRFYNNTLRGVYDSCTLPTENASAAPHTILANTYSVTTSQRSIWKHTTRKPSRTNGQAPSSLSAPFLGHAVVAPEEESQTGKRKRDQEKKVAPFKRKEPLKGRARSYMIRMLPTKEQLVELKRCFHACRVAFNFANKRVRDDKMPANVIALRKDWVRFEKPDHIKIEIKGVANLFTSNAIKDLVEAYKSNYAKLKTNPNHKFQVKDRSYATTRTEVLHVESQNSLLDVVPIKSSSTSRRRAECGLRFGNNLQNHGLIRIQGKRKVIDMCVSIGKKLQAAAKIQWDKQADAFYFIWVHDQLVQPDPDPTFQTKRVVALDPGSAPFQQWYSPTSGEYGELLSGAREGLKDKCLKIDKLRQRIFHRKKNPEIYQPKRFHHYPKKKRDNKRQRTTRTLWRKLRRDCKRLSRNVAAAHYDAANFLLERHDIVIAPVLQTGRLTEKGKRGQFGSKLARALYTWGHRLFRQRLAYAAARYPGRYVYECCEPGTSKTCTNCGAWNKNLQLGDKVYNCSHCGLHVDRQLAGARNNFFAAYGMAIGRGWDGVHG